MVNVIDPPNIFTVERDPHVPPENPYLASVSKRPPPVLDPSMLPCNISPRFLEEKVFLRAPDWRRLFPRLGLRSFRCRTTILLQFPLLPLSVGEEPAYSMRFVAAEKTLSPCL